MGLLAVCFVALLSAYARDEKTKVKGLITARTGDMTALSDRPGPVVDGFKR